MYKPSFDTWEYWAGIVIDRLTTVLHVYTKPPHPDVFIPLATQQIKIEDTANFLKKLHETLDVESFPTEPGSAETQEREEIIIETLTSLFEITLETLPEISNDMQKLLKSPWFDNCSGKLATILFKGPDGREQEGLGSGMIENGRLALSLHNLIEEEKLGETRLERTQKTPKKDLERQTKERWKKQNSSFLRQAGRVD